MRRIHHLLDRLTERTPSRHALTDFDGTRHDFQAFTHAVEDAVRALDGLGVRPGDRVMIVGENCLALAGFMLACGRLDAWALPVNARMTAEEIARIRDHAEPRARIFTGPASDEAATHGRAAGGRELTGAFGSILATGAHDTNPEPVADDPLKQVAALIYTTGTTGAPKGVMLSHGNLLHISDASRQVRGIVEGDEILCVVPMTHIFGLSSAFLAGMQAGASFRFIPRFTPSGVFDAIQSGGTVMPAVPQIYALLLQHAEAMGWTGFDAPHLRYISAGGAPLDMTWKRKVEAFFGLTLHNGYGMTEASPGICTTRVGMERADLACGPPMPGVEVRIVPPLGQTALVDNVGEVVCRGPNVMLGYYKNPAATDEVLEPDGWLRTGDLGRFTEDGALMVVGRCKELIIRSGFNVYPPEVEGALNSHPDVALSAVVGRKLADGNEEVLGFAQRVPGSVLDEATLSAYLTDRIAPYKRPGRIVIADRLPASGTGKLLKHKLLDVFRTELSDRNT